MKSSLPQLEVRIAKPLCDWVTGSSLHLRRLHIAKPFYDGLHASSSLPQLALQPAKPLGWQPSLCGPAPHMRQHHQESWLLSSCLTCATGFLHAQTALLSAHQANHRAEDVLTSQLQGSQHRQYGLDSLH